MRKIKSIAIGSDHAGFVLKEPIIKFLESSDIDVIDCGCYDIVPCDYPDFVKPAAEKVISGLASAAIVLGGSGNGEAIAANKVTGIRCALCYDLWTAEMASLHNNANCIALGSRATNIELALKIIQKWIHTDFEGGRHENRIKKIEA
tara:strand:+ start:82 stop:522 length:441 start_codon:yes stop_codon:yes gene_type:complete